MAIFVSFVFGVADFRLRRSAAAATLRFSKSSPYFSSNQQRESLDYWYRRYKVYRPRLNAARLVKCRRRAVRLTGFACAEKSCVSFFFRVERFNFVIVCIGEQNFSFVKRDAERMLQKRVRRFAVAVAENIQIAAAKRFDRFGFCKSILRIMFDSLSATYKIFAVVCNSRRLCKSGFFNCVVITRFGASSGIRVR